MADFITTWMSAYGAAKVDKAARVLLSDLLICARRDGSITYKPTDDQRDTLAGLVSAGWLAPLEWGEDGSLRTSLRVPEGV